MFGNYLVSVYEPYFNYLYFYGKNFDKNYSEITEFYSYDSYLSLDSHIRNFYNFMNARQHNYNINLWYIDEDVFKETIKNEKLIFGYGNEILKI